MASAVAVLAGNTSPCSRTGASGARRSPPLGASGASVRRRHSQSDIIEQHPSVEKKLSGDHKMSTFAVAAAKSLDSSKFINEIPTSTQWRSATVNLTQRLVNRVGSILGLPMGRCRFVPWENIDVQETGDDILLGCGSQGETFRACVDGQPVAVKLGRTVGLLTEALLATALSHSNIVKCIGWTTVPPTETLADALPALDCVEDVATLEQAGWVFAGIYELCEHRDLESFLSLNPHFRENAPFLLRTFDSILSALAELERHRMVHGDIKCQNVLLDSNLHAKVSDMALCQAIGDEMSISGTPSFFSPEQCSDWFGFTCGRSYSCKTDMFAFGCLVAKATTGELPFERLTLRLRSRRGFASPDDLRRHFRVKEDLFRAMDRVHPVCARIVRWCTEFNPEDRPTPSQVRDLLAHCR